MQHFGTSQRILEPQQKAEEKIEEKKEDEAKVNWST